ncbi:aminoglycoside phosphotransferase [Streptomyces cinnabarinus]|uniref:Aminoglycoside phosphotransferase n=1 Tax=Streptomyces cinnabarinus TaxID=67287 RepID=A0ABY7K3P7_9ACTN|nr:aminoglycoside phosphotransferase [Streptomyces cinnabarinus]WAZ19124.1 aminoglycoside phosphotransferase [Streptomyces cinnabarinus]
MPIARRPFLSLPLVVQQAVRERTGAINSARTVRGGSNSSVAACLDTEKGRVFVKGLHDGHPQIGTLLREAEINRHLPDACPRLMWRVQVKGWELLGYQFLAGRHADYRPGSPDLHLVRAALTEVQCLTVPPRARVLSAQERWASYAAPGTADLFAGDALLHTDLAPDNVLVAERACLVDWAWPTRGAAWIDPAIWALRLLAAGHTPQEADAAAGAFPSWKRADDISKSAFATASARLWGEIADNDPAAWKYRMARSSVLFAAFLDRVRHRAPG